MDNKLDFQIMLIGNGNVAHSLAYFLDKQNIYFKWFKADEENRYFSENDELKEPTIYFCAVNEQNLKKLLNIFTKKNGLSVYGHFSGSIGLDIFPKKIAKSGFILHPMQTFPNKLSNVDLSNSYFTFQGENAIYELIVKNLKKSIYILPVNLDSPDAYHLMGVFSSNFLPAIVSICIDLGRENGLSEEQTKKLILPLMKQTLQNIESSSLYDGLSGPLKRNAIDVIEKHENFLGTFKESYLKIYRLFNRTLKENIIDKE